MNMKLICIGFSAMLILSPLAANAEPLAKADPCALLKMEDVTPLLGGTPEAKSSKGACSWIIAGKQSKLVTAKYPSTGVMADMAFATARKNAAKVGPVSDLKGLGDKAFVRLGPFGVFLVIFNDGHLLQIQYKTEADVGTSEDLKVLLPVAKKAVAAL